MFSFVFIVRLFYVAMIGLAGGYYWEAHPPVLTLEIALHF